MFKRFLDGPGKWTRVEFLLFIIVMLSFILAVIRYGPLFLMVLAAKIN